MTNGAIIIGQFLLKWAPNNSSWSSLQFRVQTVATLHDHLDTCPVLLEPTIECVVFCFIDLFIQHTTDRVPPPTTITNG